jgi:hypothetical protein
MMSKTMLFIGVKITPGGSVVEPAVLQHTFISIDNQLVINKNALKYR